MLSGKKYIKIIFIIFGMIVATTAGYSIYFAKHYPTPIIDHISFDAKIQFIYENIDIEQMDTIVVGSSLALNNVQGIFLEKSSEKCSHVLNLSVWSIDASQVEQLLELADVFPNLKRIIYSGQFTSFNHAYRLKKFDADFIKKYISHQLNPIEYAAFVLNACKDISFCAKRQKEWEKKYGQKNKYTYLGFDHTGSAPLDIYGKDIIQARWVKVDGARVDPKALKALSRMAKKAYKNNIKFYFVQQPYRQAHINKNKHIEDVMKTFPKQIKAILTEHNGLFLNLHEKLKLSDKYFADRSHLNRLGSKIAAETIGEFIDKSEK